MSNVKEIQLGWYTIKPSEAFQGIERGIVQVLAKMPNARMEELKPSDEDIFQYIDGLDTADAELLLSSPWVLYLVCTGTDMGTLVWMPEELLLDHLVESVDFSA